MAMVKIVKDRLIKLLNGPRFVPAGLMEMQRYFRNYGPINFSMHHEDGLLVAVSDNYRLGSIVTSGRDATELDENIKDAILTSFEVPSAYIQEGSFFSECHPREGGDPDKSKK